VCQPCDRARLAYEIAAPRVRDLDRHLAFEAAIRREIDRSEPTSPDAPHDLELANPLHAT
jgi:hypothetical protein